MMDDRPPTPNIRRSAIQRNFSRLPEGSDPQDSDSEEEDPQDSDYEEPVPASKKLKRPPKSHPTPFKRRKASSSLRTTQRRNVDDAVKQLQPNATLPYCVVTRATADMTIIEYAHVLEAATSDSIVSNPQVVKCTTVCLTMFCSWISWNGRGR